MELSFFKMHVAGNDFILFDRPGPSTLDWGELARRLCARKTGIGANAIILVSKPAKDTWVRMFSPAGDELDPSGDALACAARLHSDSGLGSRTVALRTRSASMEIDVIDSLYIGLPLGYPADDEGATLDAAALSALAVPVREGSKSGASFSFGIAGMARATVLLGESMAGFHPPKSRKLVAVRARSRTELACRAKRDAYFDGCEASALATAAASANGLCEPDPLVRFRDGDFFASLKEDGLLYVAARADYVYSGDIHVEERVERPAD